MSRLATRYQQCADLLKTSDALCITAGAGIGVDSGLPDFRGPQGFWHAYPMYKNLGMNFVDAANPLHFSQDPQFGWGFYGHRLKLYRETMPHQGFQIMLRWITKFNLDYFVVTSNVDGQFQKAGFAADNIYEVHGSINHLQCLTPCNQEIWDNREQIAIDYKTMRAQSTPHCPYCQQIARPNILMFGDFSWLPNRSDEQAQRYSLFHRHYHKKKRLLVIEIGAGTFVPTIRHLSENLGNDKLTTVVRINPREPQIFKPHIAIDCGGLEALSQIDSLLKSI